MQYSNDQENPQNIQDSMMMTEPEQRKLTISDSPVKASNKQSRQSYIESSVPQYSKNVNPHNILQEQLQNQMQLIESREIQSHNGLQLLDNKYRYKKFTNPPPPEQQQKQTPKRKTQIVTRNSTSQKRKASHSPIQKLMNYHIKRKKPLNYSPVQSAYSPQKEKQIQKAKKEHKRIQMSRLIQHIGTELKRVQQSLSPSLGQKLGIGQSNSQITSPTRPKHIKLTNSISSPNAKSPQKFIKSAQIASPSTNVTFSANALSQSSSSSPQRSQNKSQTQVTKFSLNKKKPMINSRIFNKDIPQTIEQKTKRAKNISNLLLRSVPSARYGDRSLTPCTENEKLSLQISNSINSIKLTQSAKISPRDTIVDLLDNQHQILQKYYEVKGLKKSTVAAATLSQKGSLSPAKQIFTGVKGNCSQSPTSPSLKFSINHIRQSDSYFQGLNEHLDNQLRGIAILILQKKELEEQNGKLMTNLKSINNDINQSYVALRNVNRNLNYAMERQNQLQDEIQKIKSFANHLIGQKQRRKAQETKNYRQLKLKYDKCQDRVYLLSKEREDNLSKSRISQSERYNQIKRLTFRNEEINKLNVQLQTKSAYQRKLQDTRSNMLREKGRLLSQLINKEEIHKDEAQRVIVSRDVMKDVNKILSVVAVKKKG